MIVKMRKYSFLVYHKYLEDFLRNVREAGVLHVLEKQDLIAEDATQMQLNKESAKIKQLIKSLKQKLPENAATVKNTDVSDVSGLVEKAAELLQKEENLQNTRVSLNREFEKMEVWGDFSFSILEKLQESGLEVKFFNCNLRKFDQEWEVRYNAFIVDTIGSVHYFITVNKTGTEVDIDADPVKLSDRTAPEIKKESELIIAEQLQLKQELQQFAVSCLPQIEDYLLSLETEADFGKKFLSSVGEAENTVKVLEGWCPEENTAALEKYLVQTGVYFESADAQPDEQVPVKLKNNKFSKLYEAIGDLYDLPNYHEIDLTPFFAPFYMLFFGLCLGDAAYGLILVIAAIFMMRKAKPAMKPLFKLAIWLGSSTVVMGTVSGTFFGFNLLESKIAWLEDLKVIMLNSDQLFNTSLILGAIQIIFGMIIKAVGMVRRTGFASSLSTWGWLILILGLGGTYLFTTQFETNPEVVKYVNYGILAVGGLMVFVLNDIKRNPLINVGAGVWDTYNMATGLLGDLLSYIRLFAVGISGSVMGFVFNDLAMKMSGDIPVVSTIAMLLIMLIGHSINIFMGALGAFVHPMRLTFVEFYKNAGFEGGGKKYNPFRNLQAEKTE